MNKKIVHVVAHDKFTAGYINFMKICMKEYDHIFIVSNYSAMGSEGVKGRLIDERNVIRWSTLKEIAFGKEIRNVLLDCDKVILSGFFCMEEFCVFWPGKIFKKAYIHLWGGDFYELRNFIPLTQWHRRVNRMLRKRCFRKCAGVIFLIEGEYEKFYEITHIKKSKNYVAMMPGDPQEELPFKQYRSGSVNEITKIIIGNSATEENCHIEVFQMLKRFSREKMEIYCPLSYGNVSYGDKVIEEGKKIFGEKFHAMKTWMSQEDYYRFLSTCDIGIFNNDRQQGMGNIVAMLFLGKKVFLRAGVSMYDDYIARGFKIYPVLEINELNFDQLKEFDNYEHNIQVADEWNYMEESVEAWRKVFEAQM